MVQLSHIRKSHLYQKINISRNSIGRPVLYNTTEINNKIGYTTKIMAGIETTERQNISHTEA